MGGEDKYERETCLSALKLPILNMKKPSSSYSSSPSPDHYPISSQYPASVPFKWEEQPGKPRPYYSGIVGRPESEPEAKCLELPPNMTPSPTRVLDGPYYVGRPKFSSFRFFRDGGDSFGSRSSSGEDGSLLINWKKSGTAGGRAGGLFGKKMKNKVGAGKKEEELIVDHGPPFSLSISSDESIIIISDDEIIYNSGSGSTATGGGGGTGRRKMRRNGSFSSTVPHAKSSPSPFWVSFISFHYYYYYLENCY